MDILLGISKFWLDFFFPKSRATLELESLTPAEILNSVPTVSGIERKDTIAIFDYKHPLMRKLVWELKYSGNRQVANTLGQVMYDTLHSELEETAGFNKFDSPLLVPVPISNKRRLERGWNQSEMLAKAVKRSDHANVLEYSPQVLVKHKHTERQTKANRKERLENLQNSMQVQDSALVQGRNIVLIDDVTTTGATFSEARRALKEAGAKKVLCLALAH